MVVSINPFKVIQSYGEHVIPHYLQAKTPEGLPPHLYAVGQQAYQNVCDVFSKYSTRLICQMLTGKESQSVIITGESGAGKTEGVMRRNVMLVTFLLTVQLLKLFSIF
jgi:myosin protein heavy chain